MPTFEQYVNDRLPALLRTATAICANPALAEEIVQEVLLKLHRGWARIDELGNVDAYVRRMLVNEHISWRRKWTRLVPTERVPEQAVDDRSDVVAQRDFLKREIAKLPRSQQVALVLRYLEGLSDADIADAMQCTPSSVRSYISRGLAGLRVELSVSTPGSAR